MNLGLILINRKKGKVQRRKMSEKKIIDVNFYTFRKGGKYRAKISQAEQVAVIDWITG